MDSHARQRTRPPVLVVDDNADIRDTVRLALEDEGYRVLEAGNGQDALKQLRGSAGPLIVLLDHLMPDVDGMEALDTIATDPLLARCHAYIMLTADGRTEPVRLTTGGAEWMVPVLEKPFDLDDLLASVARARESLRASTCPHERQL